MNSAHRNDEPGRSALRADRAQLSIDYLNAGRNVGPHMFAAYPHLQDEHHQDIAGQLIGELAGV